MTRNFIACNLHLIVFALVFAACRGGVAEPSAPAGVSATQITVTSNMFSEGGTVPIDFTCDGKDAMPQMCWSSPPTGTQSLAIIVDDPDAPGGTFTHFLAYGISPDVHELKAATNPPAPARIGKNDFDAVRYNGPCPPKQEEHRYRFQVFALEAPVNLAEAATRSDLDHAMNGHVLGRGTLTALFGH